MKLRANAKINLTLDVVGKREDGYHIIDSVFQSVSLYDEVTVEKSNGIAVYCTDNSINDKSNIAYMAAKSFFDYTGLSGGAEITIKKNIPLASGMGGGSADAAAVISALDKLYKTKLNVNTLCSIGLTVGADVPFCIVGGTARVGGIGEKLQKLVDIPNCAFVTVKQGEKHSTADMYRQLDDKPFILPKTQAIVEAINKGDLYAIGKNASNAFAYVCNNEALINDIKTTFPIAASLSGSGPTVFAIYKNTDSANTASKQLKTMGYSPIICTPVSQGVIFE